MSHQSEKSNQHLLSNWKPENAQFWENKGTRFRIISAIGKRAASW